MHTTRPHLPALRFGQPYRSLDSVPVTDLHSRQTLAELSVVNAGILRRDLKRIETAFERLRALPVARLLAISRRAGALFLNETLPFGCDETPQRPQDYIELLSATSGLPHNMCRANMEKIFKVCDEAPRTLKGLMRGLPHEVLERGLAEHDGVPLSFFPAAKCLGVVLPSNSPGVHGLWAPAIAFKMPLFLKPGGQEPWTPYRLIQAFIAAGCPREAFGFYPTDHEGSTAIMQRCDRAMIFGDQWTVDRYAGDPRVEVHGPGYSKIMIGADQADHWAAHLDLIEDSVARNSGRSCVNASTVLVPRNGRALAAALAERLARYEPLPPTDPDACLSAFANPAFAEYIDGAIEEGRRTPGAVDLTATSRTGPRRVVFQGATYLRPTVIYCELDEHPLAIREFLFPFVSVVEVPQEKMLDFIGPTLVASVLSDDQAFRAAALQSPRIGRLNLGPISTLQIAWDQPHEGNLFEFLYQRRAIQTQPATTG